MDKNTTLHEFQYQKSIQWLETASQSMATTSEGSSNGVKIMVMASEYDDSSKEELEEDDNVVIGDELGVEYFNKFPTKSELVYHKYLMCASILSLFLRNPIIVGGSPLNLKIPCNIGYVHVGKAYIDLNSPINIMTHTQYNWIMRKQLEAREDPEDLRGISNFTGRVRGMHIFVGNFTYVSDFMIVEDISSAIDPRLSHVVLKKPFVELSNMTYILSLGIVKLTMELMNNEEDNKRGVDYVMNKILGFYKECLELGPEYLTGLEGCGSGSDASDEGVT
ncbi:hypothetical protein Tco_0922613 [Tanacetum coccineum]|uniref:MAK10-like protein n=1 Tax=Tanacetum coccineum TaxID=301880 RepID=A0ABQ5CZK8_9ASTR